MNLLVFLVLATAFGWWIGGRDFVAPTARRHGHTVMLGTIGVLLFCMGLSLGMNPNVVSQMETLGLKALSLSLAGASGATASVAVVRRVWRKRRA